MSTAAKHLHSVPAQDAAAPLRFISAASLFDGHDAAINIIRRLLLQEGAEVVHLGHNRSVAEIVDAALQEDADGIAVSSYQGGHMEYFKYMVDMLRERGAEHIRVVVGGGGTIVPAERAELEAHGVEKVYGPEDGMEMGLKGMIQDVFRRVRAWQKPDFDPAECSPGNPAVVGRTISMLELAKPGDKQVSSLVADWSKRARDSRAPVVGLTGTGGSGKSSLTDELLNRFKASFPDLAIAVLAVDPTRRRTGGALLGDRIRMNSLTNSSIYMRSLATRRAHVATSEILTETIDLLKAAGYGLILLETAGIGQSDSEVVDLVDFSMYVMTSDYGAASQLEKIDMLDFADMIALNKFEKRGAEDALRDIRKQWRRNHVAFDVDEADIPVYPTIASQFNDPGVNHLFQALVRRLVAKLDLNAEKWRVPEHLAEMEREKHALIPPSRERYLAEIAEAGRGTHGDINTRAEAASLAQSYYDALKALDDAKLPEPLQSYDPAAALGEDGNAVTVLRQRYNAALDEVGPDALKLLRNWPALKAAVQADTYSYKVRGREITGENYTESLSGTKVPKIAAPRFHDWGEILRFLMEENLPGAYPYTAGVYPYRRAAEDPTRQFAGEGTPERTNRRFHYLSQGLPATRLSTAFDSVTLYGEDPDERPDIYGRIGNSGVSIATVDDMKKLYSGFDLVACNTSVSMTINGPAPMILAMFMNAAIDQQVERHLRETGGWDDAQKKIQQLYRGSTPPMYEGDLPEGHDGFGLGTIGVSGDQLVDAETYGRIREATLKQVRGTVQADILKEDQAQNTCIFSTDFALRMMGDVQAHFIEHGVRNFYSVSISGYHIAEAGANPISQLAFTLANGFTIVEYYLARGMKIDNFAPNLSFFFSNGMDPEYAVIGRVARRIWARAMRERYGANARSQMLKYHIQTSGRSLHAQEIQFNDIRTTLQALYALYDNCNSLHTNAYDEAITTPTEESVRRAMAIQLIINKELGLNKNENPLQGAFIIQELTDLVEEAVYREFERISERGGVLGAMETMYQRGKIQEESLIYERRKHDGSLPIIGVNTFLPEDGEESGRELALIRSTEAEKQAQITGINRFRELHKDAAPAALAALQQTARTGGNLFGRLMETVKVCSLGQISGALYEVGGRYRRNM
ncbi:MAG TPA: methylmalonyl-CoA mutase family protein [Gammaproteobacteria bacterium]|nr:methylmalonyl-CoA mutase family protein [Gammaproteobacteria bacterium]